jgi:hypothetical protein
MTCYRLTNPLLVRFPPTTVPALGPPTIIPALGFGVDVAQPGAKFEPVGGSIARPWSSMCIGSSVGVRVSRVPAVVVETNDVVGAALLVLRFPEAVIWARPIEGKGPDFRDTGFPWLFHGPSVTAGCVGWVPVDEVEGCPGGVSENPGPIMLRIILSMSVVGACSSRPI